jgi:hypothetical protein
MTSWARRLGTVALALTVVGLGCSDGGSDSDDDDDSDIELTDLDAGNTYQGSGGGDSTSSGGSTSSDGSGGSTSDEGCPDDIPFGVRDCPDVGLECTYDNFGGTWVCTCENFGWNCQQENTGQAGATSTDGCPENEPDTGDACDIQSMGTMCDYGGTTCICMTQGGPGGGQPEWNCDGFNFGTGGTDGSGGANQGSGGTQSTECADGNSCSTPGSTCTDADDNLCFCNSSNEWQC